MGTSLSHRLSQDRSLSIGARMVGAPGLEDGMTPRFASRGGGQAGVRNDVADRTKRNLVAAAFIWVELRHVRLCG